MDKISIDNEINVLTKHISSLEKQLMAPDIAHNAKKAKRLSQDFSRKKDRLNNLEALKKIEKEIWETKEMLNQEDIELKSLAQEELIELEKKKIEIVNRLNKGGEKIQEENNGCIVEIRAGTGGEEANLFAGDLFRLYSKYALSKNWKISIASEHRTGIGGFKEIIFEINGKNCYKQLKFENGVHRVQRVPVTESSGRIHTSAASVVVYPLVEEEEVKIDPNELKIDVYRSTGPGGQSVNTTDSAVRITHLPTGIVVTCQDEKSQHKNKARAKKILASKLADKQREEQASKISEIRKDAIKTGDRSAKIRTYNFPQSRITDHRIKKSWHNLKAIMDGHLEDIITSLNQLSQ